MALGERIKECRQSCGMSQEKVAEFLATKITSNIRELEGTLNKILAKASLTHSPISLELAEQCINEVISRKEKIISADYIQEVVAKYFNISQKDLKSSKRSNDIAYPRQIAMFLCRDLANMPFTKIGESFGKRDHTTVMHAYKKIDKELRTNPTFIENSSSFGSPTKFIAYIMDQITEMYERTQNERLNPNSTRNIKVICTLNEEERNALFEKALSEAENKGIKK